MGAQDQIAAVVVDPYSSGRYLLYELKKDGIPIICVRSKTAGLDEYFINSYQSHKHYFTTTIDYDACEFNLDTLTEQLLEQPYDITAVFAGSEVGVELAEYLSDKLKLGNANGLELLEARKDKAEMQEQLRRCGVPAAKQFKSADLDSLVEWAREHNEWPVVCKPLAGCGSDGVYICRSEADIHTAHREIVGNTNPMGVVNLGIALQEFLDGEEYMVDTCSHNGKHVVCAIWVYTKRRGLPWKETAVIPTQYRLLPPGGPIQDQLADYVFKTLNAVGMKYGICHTEVFMTKRGPILVEVNARMHGLQAPELIEEATGTSLARYYVDTLVGQGKLVHNRQKPNVDHSGCCLPLCSMFGSKSEPETDRPSDAATRWLYPLKKQVRCVMLICPSTGYLMQNYEEVLKEMNLETVKKINTSSKIGAMMPQTVDIPTIAGTLLLCHEDEEQMEHDVEALREKEDSGELYIVSDSPVDVESGAQVRARGMSMDSLVERISEYPTAAVVVDPYSSGRYLVYELKQRGIQIIAIRSSLSVSPYFLKVCDNHRDYFSEVLDFEHEGESDVEILAAKLQAMPFRIAAVFGGSETGVELADRLAEHMKMPTANGTELLMARKDKAEMQERLRACGVPSADQFKSGDLNELVGWASERDQWPVVAKPVAGAGSEGVFFCQNVSDLVKAHEGIIGKTTVVGVANEKIALQEFLDGDEYIVDTCSHDGKHIAVAIWVYTKRRSLPWSKTAILSSEVTLLPSHGEIQDKLTDYVFQVLTAVGLKHGVCHTEVMMTPRGPILVEVNARMHGLQGPKLIEMATGTNKATYMADALLGANLFNELYQPGPERFLYPLKKHSVNVILCSPVKGILQEPIKELIMAMNLESAWEILPNCEVGSYLRQSVSVDSCAGTVLLVHTDMDLIQRDIKTIREAEENGSLYIVGDEDVCVVEDEENEVAAMTNMESLVAYPQAVVVVDPYSSGRYYLYELKNRNVKIICVRSTMGLADVVTGMFDAHRQYFSEVIDFCDFNNDIEELMKTIKNLPFEILSVIAGSEVGVALADELSELFQMKTSNGTKLLAARTDKAAMQDRLHEMGVPSARQIKSSDVDELVNWALARDEWPVVCKPVSGAGSEGVFMCKNAHDIRRAHKDLIGSVSATAQLTSEVALQEFLHGEEWIIDTVSFEGKHIIVAMWVHGKQKGIPGNDRAIVPIQYHMTNSSGEEADKMAHYSFQVLDAVGMKYGPCHLEVMMTSRGPILVEVNARMHGLQGPKLIEMTTGTNKATWSLDALIGNGALFEERYVEGPGRYLYPVHKKCVAMMLVSGVEGILESSIKSVIEDMNLESVLEILPAVQPNQVLKKTIDLTTVAGTVLLVHESEEKIEQDKERIREAEANGEMYVVAPMEEDDEDRSPRARLCSLESVMADKERPMLPEAVVIVDPFSSGRYLLYELEKMGIPMIIVRSTLNLGKNLSASYESHRKYYTETIDFSDYEENLDLFVEALKELPYQIVSVFAGCEAGVILSEKLAEALKLRHANGTQLLEARTEKAEMQDQLRRMGVRAAEQFKSGDKEELQKWAANRNQWPVVAKPCYGAGSDGIFFCRSIEDIAEAHAQICGTRNVIGTTNSDVALQEFLDGDEYIVDTISHNGKHIIVSIWVYTKRRGLPWSSTAIIPSMNELLEPTGERQDQLAKYIFDVLNAVGYKNGPCHSEVMFTKDGPVLVEVNTRLHGLQGPELLELATGTNKATYAIDTLYGGGKLFEQEYRNVDPDAGRFLYTRKKACYQVVLHSDVEGTLMTDIGEEIRELNLPSMITVIPFVKVGENISKTVDVLSASGTVLLVHERLEQIHEDINRIRQLEARSLYRVSEDGARTRLDSMESVEKAELRSAALADLVELEEL